MSVAVAAKTRLIGCDRCVSLSVRLGGRGALGVVWARAGRGSGADSVVDRRESSDQNAFPPRRNISKAGRTNSDLWRAGSLPSRLCNFRVMHRFASDLSEDFQSVFIDIFQLKVVSMIDQMWCSHFPSRIACTIRLVK